MNMTGKTLSLMAGLAMVTGTASADVITPTDVQATSWWGPFVPPVNLINDVKFNNTGDPYTSTQEKTNTAEGQWHAGGGAPGTGPAVVDDQKLTFDLGGAYNLTHAYIWQFNQGNQPGRGVNEFEVLVSTDGVNFINVQEFGSVDDTYNLSITAAAATEPVQAFQFAAPALGVTHVQIDINTAHSGATSEYVGLAQVLFEGTAVPEPGSLALLGLGGLCVLRRRR